MKRFAAILMCCLFIPLSAYAADKPSEWASADISEAAERGIAGDELLCNYQAPITRGEFCTLCTNTINSWGITNIPHIVEDISFFDTTDSDILFCASIGVVAGTGNGSFEPERAITRQEAAKMLCNTFKITQTVTDESGIYLPHIFGDSSDISAWARESIYAMYHTGIMMGDSQNNFNPLGTYTREQAVATFNRLFEAKDKTDFTANAELYPDIETAKRLYNSENNGYCLNAAYEWDNGEYKYEPIWHDAFGNSYTAAQKGYLKPLNIDILEVITSVGVGVGASVVIDNNGKQLCETSKYELVAQSTDKYITREIGGACTVYDKKTGNEIKTYDLIDYVGCGMYSFCEGEYRGYMNSEFKEIMPAAYKNISQTFLNDLCVLQKQDNSFIIVNKNGEILKSFKLNLNKYNVDDICGTNMLLTDMKTNTDTIYRSYSGKTVSYPTMNFLTNGDIEAQSDGKKYILDKEGNVKADINAMGYDGFSQLDGIYSVYKLNKDNWSIIQPYDIMSYDGKIIRTGVTALDEIIKDTSGVYACKSAKNEITLFDGSGCDIGIIKTDSEISEYKYINGLIFITDIDGNSAYYSPTGKLLNLT